jgi:hypothetical protein
MAQTQVKEAEKTKVAEKEEGCGCGCEQQAKNLQPQEKEQCGEKKASCCD